MGRLLAPIGAPGTPRRSIFRALERPRLNSALDAASRHSVTLLVAGAGYGKSVALDHWIARLPDRSLLRFNTRSETMDNLFGFAAGLAQSLSAISKNSPKTVASAIAAARKSTAPETDLASWLVGHLRKFKGFIVVDDLHRATDADPRVAQLLFQLVNATKETINWVMATRSSAELPVASWIAYGLTQMPLDESELRFSAEEMTLVAESIQAPLTQPQINELHYLTKGWPAGVAFALMNANAAISVEDLAATTRGLSYKFMAEQVFNRLTPAEQELVLRTSVYEELTPAILKAAGVERAQRQLETVREKSAFLSCDAKGTYRYHDLFREYLQRELLHAEISEPAWNDAGDAYASLGEIAEAMFAYGRGDNVSRVCDLLEVHGFTLIKHGGRESVLKALSLFENVEGLNARPGILGIKAKLEYNAGNVDRADSWYRLALSQISDVTASILVALEYADDLVQSDRIECFDLLAGFEGKSIGARAEALRLGMLAMAHWWQGDFGRASDLTGRALLTAAPVNDPELDATLCHRSAFLAFCKQDMPETERLANKALVLAQSLDMLSLCARVHALLYNVAYNQDDFNEALWWLRQMEKAATEAGDATLLFSATIATYEIEIERGNTEAVSRLDRNLEAFDAGRFPRATQALAPAFALRATWTGRFADALAFVEGTETEQPGPSRRALRAAEIALYAAAAQRREYSEKMLSFASEHLRMRDPINGYSEKRVAKTLAYLAMTALLLGRASTSNKYIGEMEQLAHRLSKRYKILIETIRALYMHAETRSVDEDVQRGFADLRSAGLGGLTMMLQKLPNPKSTKSNSSAGLSRTEIGILRALAQYGSTPEIARRTGRNPNTIDWHVKAILKKLGCKSRHHAVAFARQHGIL